MESNDILKYEVVPVYVSVAATYTGRPTPPFYCEVRAHRPENSTAALFTAPMRQREVLADIVHKANLWIEASKFVAANIAKETHDA